MSNNLIDIFPNIKENVQLKNLNWFKLDAVAKYFYKPTDINELSSFLKEVAKTQLPIFVLGAGSNILFKEEIFNGVVIKLDNLNSIELKNDSLLKVESGCMNISVSNFALRQCLTGVEFLCGIPGSIGGGLAMNAGAFGREFKDIIVSAQGLNEEGEIVNFSLEDLGFSYRKNAVKDFTIFTSCVIKTDFSDKESIYNRMQEIRDERENNQPKKVLTGGSTFANPINQTTKKAWQLIEEVGLRGYEIGGAHFSEKHCNFIVNHNNATSQDIIKLINLAISKVKEKFNIDLHPEIKIVG